MPNHTKKRRMERSAPAFDDNKSSAPEPVATTEDGGPVYHIEKVLEFRRRKVKGKVVGEYLIQWLDDEGTTTWEPEDCLWDSGYEDAHQARKAYEEQQLLLAVKTEEDSGIDERKPAAVEQAASNCGAIDSSNNNESQITAEVNATKVSTDASIESEEGCFDWSDSGQVDFRKIERIHVDDPTAAQRVKDAREAGVPVIITGHTGWAQFAAPWLKKIDKDSDKSFDAQGSTMLTGTPLSERQNAWTDGEWPKDDDLRTNVSTKAEDSSSDLLDLSRPHAVDVEKMIAAIGNELVPINTKQYNESRPIEGKMSIQRFLQNPNNWPSDTPVPSDMGRSIASRTASRPRRKTQVPLYLHQWQFPTSETAVPKLCGKGKNAPLPNGILGDDLLKYWHDPGQCAGDSNYQYLFMGTAGTMSKLHTDDGGLLITIAPIVGKKEVLLVHRADGAGALYHCTANIEEIDLDRFPLMYSARLWKSTIVPGEILLIPQGTLHQCRNLTPCLSYSRFYLDTVNLRAFYESWRDKKAPEIDYEDIIWNAAIELETKVNDFVNVFRQLHHNVEAELANEVNLQVSTLQTLRNISREITLSIDRLDTKYGEKDWHDKVGDIDQVLYRFRHRFSTLEPPLHDQPLSAGPAQCIKNQHHKFGTSKEQDWYSSSDDSDTVTETMATTSIQPYLDRIPKLSALDAIKVISDNIPISIGDNVAVKLEGRGVNGKILSIKDQMTAALVQYDDFPSCDCEFIPIDCLRIPVVGGEASVEVGHKNLMDGMVVHALDDGQEYRAVVKKWRLATFYHVKLLFNGSGAFERWLPRESIICKILVGPKLDSKATGNHDQSFVEDLEVNPQCMRADWTRLAK